MKNENAQKRVFRNLSWLAFLVVVLSLIVEVAQAEHQQAPERRRPLARLFGERLRGTDLTIRGIQENGRTMAASCQSTPVAKRELDSPQGMCRLAYLTAAHCVDSRFSSISFLGIGDIQKTDIKMSIPNEYFERGGQNSRQPKGGDSATLVFDISCDKAESVVPVPLAPVDSQGTTVINSKHVYLQKRQEETTGNRGQGAQILADVNGTDGAMFRFFAPSPQGYAIVGGDSGGPIFNERGQLVCPISGSEYEFKREQNLLTRLPDGTPDKLLDPFTVVCDKRAIGRLRADLAKFGLSPVSSGESEELSERARRDSGAESAATPRPLLGNSGSGLGLSGNPGTQNENGCEGGVCPLPNQSGSQQPHNSDVIPGLRNRPQVDEPSTETAIPARSSGGMKEIGPVRNSDLAKVFEDAKKKGFKHIIVRYGNDARCKYCRILAGELRNLFGKDSDVLVIKVEDSVPNTKQGIPQSELYAIDENGNWKQEGETQFGSGVGADYKQKVQALRSRKKPPVPQPQPQQQPQDFSQGTSNPQRGIHNGYQFEPVQDKSGLQYRRPEEPQSDPTAIFLKRMPDGSRRAARKESDGSLTFLSKDAEEGLRQYYQSNKEKVAKLSQKHQKYIEEFLRSSKEGTGNPQPEPQQPQQQQQPQLPQQREPKSADDAEARKAIDQYENGMKYIDGSPREYFPKDTFNDVPKGGTGKIILAYFGPKDRQLEAAAKENPFIEVRNYPYGSPEHRHASLFRTQALALDGLGRKITRYQMSPREAFRSLASSEEVSQLKRYLDAKKHLAGANQSSNQPEPPAEKPQPQPQRQPRFQRAEHPPVNGQAVAAILEGKCVNCHKGLSYLDGSLKTTSGLLEHLKSATDNTIEDMAERAQLKPEEIQKLKDYRNHSSNTGSHSSTGASSGSSRVGEARKREVTDNGATVACYMSNGERRSRIENLPEFQVAGSPIASAVNEALNNGQAVFYDGKSVPRTWQSRERELLTERNPTNPRMYSKMGYHSDGSREFPWNKPAGTDASGDSISSEKFFIPANNRQLASVVNRTRANSPSYFGRSENVNGPNLGWNFEKGATFGEVLKVTDSETGEKIPFEIRLRRKNNEGVWQMDVLRPFESPSDLLSGLKKLCIESKNPPAGCASLNWASLEKPVIRNFESREFVNKQNLGTKLDPLKLSSTAATALAEKASLQVLPDMPPDVVRALLKTTPFKSVFGKPWTEGQNGASEGWAPTSNSSFSIVPKNYFGGFIAMNQVSCMKCHESAGRHVDNFDPKLDRAAGIVSDPEDAPRSRTWYNFIPGNDGILSFHPYDAKKVAQGAAASTQSFAECLKRSGLVK